MREFACLEPAIDPNNRISFLLDWEITMKCNLDCSYCPTGIWGGHDNSTAHPDKQACFEAIDFMYRYVDLYMAYKTASIKYVVINVYGGESLHHPDIVEILQAVRDKHLSYREKWHLTVTTTTNAIVSENKLAKIIPLIDEFTVSYHAENRPRQKQQFKNNLLAIAAAGKRQKCVVLMHERDELFDDCKLMIDWLQRHSIKLLPRQLDGVAGIISGKRLHNEQQVRWFSDLYQSRSFNASIQLPSSDEGAALNEIGRSCCGGRQLCPDQDYHSRTAYVTNTFTDWYCSVNHFFLFVKQVTGDIFVNKDCKMDLQSSIGPIGHLDRSESLLEDLGRMLSTNSLPVIQCKKSRCLCGLCAPKAQQKDVYQSIMAKYQA